MSALPPTHDPNRPEDVLKVDADDDDDGGDDTADCLRYLVATKPRTITQARAERLLTAVCRAFTFWLSGCIHWRMTKVLTVRIAPGLLAKAEARAVRLGLDRAGYVRSLIEHDLAAAGPKPLRRFASQDLVGAFRLGGVSATNRRVRKLLKRRASPERETDR